MPRDKSLIYQSGPILLSGLADAGIAHLALEPSANDSYATVIRASKYKLANSQDDDAQHPSYASLGPPGARINDRRWPTFPMLSPSTRAAAAAAAVRGIAGAGAFTSSNSLALAHKTKLCFNLPVNF